MRLLAVAVVVACVATAQAFITQCDNAATGALASQAFGGLCVGFYAQTGDWHAAANACESRGGWLAYPRTVSMGQGMNTLGGGIRGWIGVHDMPSEGTFTSHGWDGGLIDFTNWNGIEPNDSGGGEDCGEIRGFTHEWNDIPCTHTLQNHWCEFPMFQDVDDEAACSAVEDGTLVFQSAYASGECVFMPNNAKNWANADDYCKGFRRNGVPASLVKIVSQEYNDLVDSITPPAGFGGADSTPWIGGHDIGEENTFVWVDGSMFECQYTNWGTGEPNDLSGEDCVEILDNGKWNDKGCELGDAFVCGWPTADIDTCSTEIFDDDCTGVTITKPGLTARICFADGGMQCPASGGGPLPP